MKHPLLIGVASLIPGLGYLMLGQARKALNVWMGLLIAVLVYMFSPIELLWDLAVVAFLGIWIAQIVWAGREAALERRIVSGEVAAARESAVSAPAPPPGLDLHHDVLPGRGRLRAGAPRAFHER